MRRISIIILSLFIGSQAMAQTSQPTSTPTDPLESFKDNSGKIKIESKDRVVIELMANNWIWNDTSSKVQPRWYSRGINFFLMYDMPLGETRLSFAPGIGFGNENYYVNSVLSIDTNNVSSFIPIRNVIGLATDYKKYKISNTFVEVPVEFRYRSIPDKNDRSWKFALGARLGYRLTSSTKYKGDDYTGNNNVGNVKYKTKADLNLSNFKYGVTARVGYGPINIIGYYGLNNMFKSEAGPKINTFSVGIQLNGL